MDIYQVKAFRAQVVRQSLDVIFHRDNRKYQNARITEELEKAFNAGYNAGRSHVETLQAGVEK